MEPNRYRHTWAPRPGVGLLVSSGLTMFFLRWRTTDITPTGAMGKITQLVYSLLARAA